jgi:DNA-binding XRE family transcriptional regulator
MNPGQAIGKQVAVRRDELNLKQHELAEMAGFSIATMGAIEGGRRPTMSLTTKRGLCAALGWSPDSIDRILRGEEPELLDQPKEHTATTVGAPFGGLPTDSEGLKRLIREAVAEALADRLP